MDLNSGSAYIYRYNGSNWVEEDKLLASDGELFDFFGHSVSISDDVIIIGAHGESSASGAAYVYRYNGSNWVEEAKLTASDGEASDYFGEAVSVSGGVAVIGATGDNYSRGSAYVFRYNGSTWVEEAKLTASDGTNGDELGKGVSLYADVAVVGAYYDDSGSAYVFRYNGSNWVEEDKLLASDGNYLDRFGQSVSVEGDVALIGAPGDNSGSAYIFRFDEVEWVEGDKLLASDGEADDEFGSDVSLSGDRALIGAPEDDDSGDDSGVAYVFRYNEGQWNQKLKLLASDGSGGDILGTSVSLSGDTALVGAFGDDDLGVNSGSAYVFDLAE